MIIMLTQLLMIYGGREEIQKDIDIKVSRLAERLKNKAKEADDTKERTERILLRLHEAGGCGAQDGYAEGWDEAITEAIRIVEEETGTRIEEVLE